MKRFVCIAYTMKQVMATEKRFLDFVDMLRVSKFRRVDAGIIESTIADLPYGEKTRQLFDFDVRTS
jgi:hypothetical protein